MLLYTDLAEYYFEIENHHRNIDTDIAFIRSMLHQVHNPSILDAGCGSGEHLNQLIRYGIKCTGIDSSTQMLDVAKKRCSPKIEFIEADIRDMGIYEQFHLIFSIFGTINYFIEDEEIDKIFWNMWRALKPEGKLLLEVWNSYPIESIKQKNVSKISTTKYGFTTIERNRGFKQLDNYAGKSICEVNYLYILTGPNGVTQLQDQHIMRTFTMNELAPFITNNGFEIDYSYGSVLKEPITGKSKKMLIVCRKE